MSSPPPPPPPPPPKTQNKNPPIQENCLTHSLWKCGWHQLSANWKQLFAFHDLLELHALILACRHEYGEAEVTLELVESMDEAIDHLHAYGSGHTECIVTGGVSFSFGWAAGMGRQGWNSCLNQMNTSVNYLHAHGLGHTEFILTRKFPSLTWANSMQVVERVNLFAMTPLPVGVLKSPAFLRVMVS